MRAVRVPPHVFNLTLKLKVHHLEDLVARDGDWANSKYGFYRAGASVYLLDIFRKWHKKYRADEE